MACDPTRIRHAEVHVIVFQIEHIFRRQVGADHVAAMDMDDALGFSGCSGGVEDVEGGFRIELFRVTDCAFMLDPFVPIEFLWSGERYCRCLAADHDDMPNSGTSLECFVYDGFEVDNLAPIVSHISSDDDFCLGVVHATREGRRAES